MADAWGGSWGSAWGVSWGSGGPPPPPPHDTHDGGHFLRRHADEYIEEVRDRLKRAEEAREQTTQEQKAAAKQLRKALENAYHGIVEEAPEEAARIAEIAAPRPAVKIDGRKFLRTPKPIDWGAIAADLDRVGRILAEMESRRIETAWLAADEEDIELLLLAL